MDFEHNKFYEWLKLNYSLTKEQFYARYLEHDRDEIIDEFKEETY